MSENSADSHKATFSLTTLKKILAEAGCTRFFFKNLAENDNSKNQIYLGMSFEVLNIFPNINIYPVSDLKEPIFKAGLSFSWVDENGNDFSAPESKLILYPHYPEVRFSGFLKGCKGAPSDLLNRRLEGRVLFLGIKADGNILGYVAPAGSNILNALKSETIISQVTVFNEISLGSKSDTLDSRQILFRELRRIYNKKWIDSKRLKSDGTIGPCPNMNCGGFTLEAELGIKPNSYSEPDFFGWEVKQHAVRDFKRFSSGAITLMTPEPDGGEYKDLGIIHFIKTYGYLDKTGRANRMNFGGVHKVGYTHPLTNLELKLLGYAEKKGIENPNGCVALVNSKDKIAASWSFAGMMAHWNRKHNKSVYVPSMINASPHQYCYSNIVKTGEGTDFLKFLKAFSAGNVYYDPGIKCENFAGSSPTTKRRSQFRIKFNDLGNLYNNGIKVVDVLKE